MKKRITALLLCLVMVFSLIPTSVWATELPAKPAKTPTFSDVKVQVKCSADSANHPIRTYDLSNEDFRSSASNLWDHPDYGTWHYTIVLNRAELIKQFDKDTGKIHTDTTPNADTRITLNWDSDKEEWVQSSSEPVVIECGCKTEIVPPTDGPSEDDVKAALGNVTVKCINPGTKHTPCAYWALGGNDGYQLTKNDDGTYNVVVNAAPFVTAYSKSELHAQKQAHNLASADTLTWVLTFDKESSKWVGAPKVIGVDDTILVTHAPKDYKEVGKIADKDDVITTKCVNSNKTANKFGITVGFTSNVADKLTVVYTGNGTYKATFSVENCVTSITKDNGRCTHTERQHDLLTKELVTWLLSVKVDGKGGYVWSAEPKTPGKDDVCNVAHRVKVTFDENYENASTTDVMYKYNTAEVKKGTIPTAPDRTGYTFKGWNTKKDGTGEAFNAATFVANADVTYYAQWKVAPHNVYAFTRVNSYFAPLTKAEYDTPVTLNEATLSRLGLGSYNDNGYISIGVLNNFDKMALTEDMYWDADAELTAVVEELAKSIVLEQGVTMDTAKKIAWTTLYQVDNSEYTTAAGYPTNDETGYQLAGNLNLATVMFNAGGDNVKNMPAVNYVYDNVAEIYDFYFAGDTFTLPTTEPTRTGYTFKGWSAEVIPSENDAECYDADADADAGAEGEKDDLLKAGATYTINNGGVKFTAQWKINTYNVTFDSNGGSAVEPQNVDYRAKVTKPAEPTREGYHFMGWFNGDKEWNFDEDTMGAGNMTLTAKWEINKYTVSFDSKGGIKVDSQIVEHGSTATKPRTPHRNDYTFKGWYLDGKKFDFSTPITGDITLVARWTTKTSGGSNSSSDTTTKDNGKTVQSGKTFDGGIALYVGLSVLSATGSALVITKKKRG